jgi:hypothetical protein
MTEALFAGATKIHIDADKPQTLRVYAAKSTKLAVEPKGNEWVIRGR